MTQYVVGFAFDRLNKVWLTRRVRPRWQEGLLNGIGGKIESGETAGHAMSREFLHKAGVHIPEDQWLKFHQVSWGEGDTVEFFTTRLIGSMPRTTTDEKILPMSWMVLAFKEWASHVQDLPHIIPMAYTYLMNKENPK